MSTEECGLEKDRLTQNGSVLSQYETKFFLATGSLIGHAVKKSLVSTSISTGCKCSGHTILEMLPREGSIRGSVWVLREELLAQLHPEEISQVYRTDPEDDNAADRVL